MKFLSDLKKKNLSNKICLLRVDFNLTDDDLKKQKVPLRIKSILPTIKFLLNREAKVVILSHRGRPAPLKRGISNSPACAEASAGRQFLISKQLSLKPFVRILSKLVKKPVHFINFDKKTNFIKAEDTQKIYASINGSIFLVENLRFFPGEDKNDQKFAGQLASLGTIYVNDAFGVSHRKNASVAAITKFLPSYAGLSLENELKNLNQVMRSPKKPLIIILGGAKISDKIGVIKNFLKKVKGQKSKVNCFLTGGGVANTFFAAQGLPIGDSLYEKEMLPIAQQLLTHSTLFRVNPELVEGLKSPKIILPIDVVVHKKRILDIGPKTVKKYAEIIKNAKTIVWNGPMGYIEDKRFTKGTKEIAKAIIKSRAFAVIGGGETTSTISNFQFPISKQKVFLSTGGGAMLEYLAGKKLPGIEALK